MQSPKHSQSHWRIVAVLFGAIVMTLCWTHIDTIRSMIRVWMQSDTFGHCFAVPFISGYLVWRNGGVFISGTEAKLAGIGALLAVSLLWALGALVDVLVVKQFAVVASIVCLSIAFFGFRFLSRNLFPLAFLFFMVPVGQFLVDPLVDLTAVTTVHLVSWTGIPVFRDGVYFSVPNGNFEVADACSGVRFLIVSLVLGSFYAYITYRSQLKRLAFLFGLVFLSIVANSLRAYIIVLMAYFSDFTIGVGDDHLYYGWLFFGLVLFATFWIGSTFADNVNTPQPYPNKAPSQSPWSLGSVAISCVIVIFLGHALPENRLEQARRNLSELPAPGLPARLSQSNTEGVSTSWVTSYMGARVEDAVTYQQGMVSIDMRLIHYGLEDQAGELINSQNLLYDKEMWGEAGQNSVLVQLSDGGSLTVNSVTLRDRFAGRRMVWYWHDVSGKAESGGVETKVSQLLSLLIGRYRGASVVALALDYQFEDKQAHQLLRQFLRDNWGDIRGCLHAQNDICRAVN